MSKGRMVFSAPLYIVIMPSAHAYHVRVICRCECARKQQRTMTNKEKLEEVAKFLKNEKINYVLRPDDVVKKSNLYIPKWKIGVKIEDENAERYFRTHKRYISVVFIRDTETADFVVEKVQTVIVQRMIAAQRKFMKKSR